MQVRVFPAPPPPDDADRNHGRRWQRPEDRAEGMGQFLLGVGRFGIDSLNDHLQAAGYERLGSVMTVIGGEGHGVLDNGAVIGGRGAAILGPGGDGPGDMRTHIGGGFGMFEAGYAPVHNRNLMVMFLGGFGGYGMGLRISEERQARFDDVLDSPRRGTELGAGGVLLGLTFGLDARVPIGEADNGQRGFFTFGLRLSGLYGPPMGEWELGDGSRVTGGPNPGLRGIYAAIAIGFGGRPEDAP